MFQLEGFKLYGWYLTLVQFAYYTMFALIEKRWENAEQRRWVRINVLQNCYNVIDIVLLITNMDMLRIDMFINNLIKSSLLDRMVVMQYTGLLAYFQNLSPIVMSTFKKKFFQN